MSTFGGRLLECDVISIDHFENDNLLSNAFFLSHFHTDHMTGLASPELYTVLSRNNRKIYTHPHTKTLMEKNGNEELKKLVPFVVGREVNHPFTIYLDDFHQETAMSATSHHQRPHVNVTFLSAKHCVGSVMMLFEFSTGKTVLYTGDFRLTSDDWKRFRALREPATGKVKRIDALYFDSTFCDRDYRMPTRAESKEALVRNCREWLAADSRNKVLLRSYAHFGHEFLICAIHSELGEKCHVSTEKYGIYSCLGSSLSLCVSADPSECRVHCCTYWKNEEWMEVEQKRTKMTNACPDCSPEDPHVMVIKASMMIFHIQEDTRVWYEDSMGVYHLSYSCHSSLEEIRSAFSYLRPLSAYPNVIDWKNKLDSHSYMKHLIHLLRVPKKEPHKDESTDMTWDNVLGNHPWNAEVNIDRLKSLDEERDYGTQSVSNVLNDLRTERTISLPRIFYRNPNEEEHIEESVEVLYDDSMDMFD